MNELCKNWEYRLLSADVIPLASERQHASIPNRHALELQVLAVIPTRWLNAQQSDKHIIALINLKRCLYICNTIADVITAENHQILVTCTGSMTAGTTSGAGKPYNDESQDIE